MRDEHRAYSARAPIAAPSLRLMLTLCLGAATPVAAAPSTSGKNAAVITTWNQIAVTTLMNTVPPPAGPGGQPTHFIYYAFTHLSPCTTPSTASRASTRSTSRTRTRT